MLFLAGCGVMNSPKNPNTAPEGSGDAASSSGGVAGSAGANIPSPVRKIAFVKLPVTVNSTAFVEEYNSTYQIFVSRSEADRFFEDMNLSAQTQLPEDTGRRIASWIAHADAVAYSRENLLYYPLQLQQDCDLNISDDGNSTLFIDTTECTEEETFYPILAGIDKSLPQIRIEISGEGNVTIENR
jgi:hypothetical protein